MAHVQINSSSLENVKRQFDQDCLLTFNGYVYHCNSGVALARQGMPVDKDGYPTPVKTSDIPKLVAAMEEGYLKARSQYIQRCSALELRSLTKEAEVADERAE